MSELHDDLTGVYNRKGLYLLWRDRIAKQDFVQMFFIDLDNFKGVNDIYGHKAGDDVLVCTGSILKEIATGTGEVIRLGGDEFVVLFPGKYEREQLERIALSMKEKMRDAVLSCIAFNPVTLSIGILQNAPVEMGLDRIISYSDTAMYYAKEFGKNRYLFFDDHADRIRREGKMERSAPEALEKGNFKVLYYPVIHLQNGRLLRTVAETVWVRKEEEDWRRDQYASVLEKNGFIKQIDLFSLDRVCRDCRALIEAGQTDTLIAVRLSLLLLEENCVDLIGNILTGYGVPKGRLEILLDERFLGGRGAERFLNSIHRLMENGYAVALMNVGEDFSSMRYLESLSFSSVYYDKEYLKRGVNEQKDTLYAFFHLTRRLHLLSIAQGVDSAEGAEYMTKNGCEGGAGAYFTEGLPLQEYIRHISALTERDAECDYHFLGTLTTDTGKYPGRFVGNDVKFVPGVSKKHGGLYFGGGQVESNLLRLPGDVLPGGSYTVSMWIRPSEVQNWTSAFYARMQNGFVSFMPTVSGNLSMLRLHGDKDTGWNDVMTDALPVGIWSFVSLIYDAVSANAQLYVNGEFRNIHRNISELGRCESVWLGGDIYQASYQGEISALTVCDIPMREVEIQELYNRYIREEGFCGNEKAGICSEYAIHDPAVYEDPVTKLFYIYATHSKGMVSGDLIHWKPMSRIVSAPEEAQRWTGSEDVWAPDIVKVGDEYRLYCSNSTWGSQRSCIFLAVSDKAEGPFIPRDIVVKTDDTLDVNGIDANIIEDHESGEQYLLYGSFWGGIHLLPLDRESGLARDRGPDGCGVGSIRQDPRYKAGTTIKDLPPEEQLRRQGICLARRPLWTDGAVEGPYMIYCRETGYYYLFVSYGSLQSDYNIRIGRSRKVTGPFLDYFGRDMADTDDADCTRGLMIDAGYCWLTGMPYMAPGHNSVLQRENGEMFMVSHIRRMRFLKEDCGMGLLQIRRLYPTPDGWLIAGAQPYARETFPVARTPVIPGAYERIELRPSVPQGIMHAHPLHLFEDGCLECCSVRGRWKQIDEYTLEFVYGPITEYVHIEKGLDHDLNLTTVLLTGLTDQGICTWGKKQVQTGA